MEHRVITIDGFAGVGKSTVAAEVARRLGYVHLNSGSIYRAVAHKAMQRDLDLRTENVLKKLLEQISIEYKLGEQGQTDIVLRDPSSTEPLVSGEVLRERLHSEEISQGASLVALLPCVRDFANRIQKSVSLGHSVVVEGRDAGTVVFPAAKYKFFLTASAEIRARRRFFQVRNKAELKIELSGEEYGELSRIVEEIQLRDKRDSERALAPTKKAEDAIPIDTSELTANEVVERIIQKINK